MTGWKPAEYCRNRALRMPPLLCAHTLASFAVLILIWCALALILP